MYRKNREPMIPMWVFVCTVGVLLVTVYQLGDQVYRLTQQTTKDAETIAKLTEAKKPNYVVWSMDEINCFEQFTNSTDKVLRVSLTQK